MLWALLFFISVLFLCLAKPDSEVDDAADFASELRFAQAADGTTIPISLFFNNRTRRDNAPLQLGVYGAYGMCAPLDFSPARLAFMRRGGTLAFAHVRGGGENGRRWYRSATGVHKKRSITDFLSCAQNLKSSGPLCARGMSAGGLVAAAALNEQPELFKAAVLEVPPAPPPLSQLTREVPFVDVLATMSDPTLPLTTAEYSEWGNPADAAVRDAMRGYSPCDNVRAAQYPPTFLTASFHDFRVVHKSAFES